MKSNKKSAAMVKSLYLVDATKFQASTPSGANTGKKCLAGKKIQIQYWTLAGRQTDSLKVCSHLTMCSVYSFVSLSPRSRRFATLPKETSFFDVSIKMQQCTTANKRRQRTTA